jgi:hypothetical protein
MRYPALVISQSDSGQVLDRFWSAGVGLAGKIGMVAYGDNPSAQGSLW